MGGVSPAPYLFSSSTDSTVGRRSQMPSDSSTQSSPGENGDKGGKRKKFLIGIITVAVLAISWVGTQQFAQSAVQLSTFDAPYFTVWLGTCWMTLCFPVYGIFIALKYRERLKISEALRDSAKMFQTPKLTARQFFLQIVPMNFLWLITNYLYIFGLKFIAATDASAIFASNVAFVYMLSICIIRERLYFIRTVACLLCISGVILFAYVEGFGGGSGLIEGILMAVASAFGAALYKVIFKLWMGNANLGQVSLFLSLIGVSNALFMWTIFIVLYATGVEFFLAEDIPWRDLNASNFLGLLFNFTINFGVAYTYPLFISIAMLLGIPLNAVVDIFVKSVTFSAVRLAAAVLIVAGFGIMLLPEEWNKRVHRVIFCKTGQTKLNDPDNEAEHVTVEHKSSEEKMKSSST